MKISLQTLQMAILLAMASNLKIILLFIFVIFILVELLVLSCGALLCRFEASKSSSTDVVLLQYLHNAAFAY